VPKHWTLTARNLKTSPLRLFFPSENLRTKLQSV
jgi:hypothetical protein